MTEAAAKVHISLVEGILQIEGSEKFVSEQIARLEPHIIRAFENRDQNLTRSNKATGKNTNFNDGISINEYDQLFADKGDKIQILKAIPGTGKAPKTINIALLLMFAYGLKGVDAISSDLIREVCRDNACLDESNFAGVIKRDKEDFVYEAKSKQIKLTAPGKKKAETLAKSLNAS